MFILMLRLAMKGALLFEGGSGKEAHVDASKMLP